MLIVYIIGIIVSFSFSCAVMIKSNKPEMMGFCIICALLWFIWLPFIILTTIFVGGRRSKAQ